MLELSSAGRRFVGVALVATVIGGALIWSPDPVAAQTVREVFEKVAPTVVVIRARGREVTTAASRALPRPVRRPDLAGRPGDDGGARGAHHG